MQPNIYFEDSHCIDRTLIDPDALYVMDKLTQAGFTAYLVGGSVRDLLTKRRPKDFDISTSARPEQVKAIFQRQCILIGRRFRLAHVRFGHHVIEVATFRSGDNTDDDLITNDNQWGTPQEDVLRRDFTINGLFYDAVDHAVIDYVGGWEDIQRQLIRTIGDPQLRFKQDPVRLLRLLKFRARYGFEIDPAAEAAIHVCRQEITKSSPARILEEVLRMLESGAAAPFFQLLAEYDLLQFLFPYLMDALHTPQGKRLFHYLTCADQLHKHKDKMTLDRTVLTACLVFPLLEHAVSHYTTVKGHPPHMGDISLLTSSLVREVLVHAFPHFPKRLVGAVISLLVAQYRLTPLTGKRHHRERLMRHKEFGIALQFLKLRALVDAQWVEVYTTLRRQYRTLSHHSVSQRPHRHFPPRKRPHSRR